MLELLMKMYNSPLIEVLFEFFVSACTEVWDEMIEVCKLLMEIVLLELLSPSVDGFFAGFVVKLDCAFSEVFFQL